MGNAETRSYVPGRPKYIIEDSSSKNSMLCSFIKRKMSDTENDYGWLEPNGTFHAVEWEEHQEWADEWIRNNIPENEYLYGTGFTLLAGDYLVKKGWILLHNPSQGIAFATRSRNCRITKNQKKFLYDYYMERNCEKEANKFYWD
ncbi:hypothetical protein C8E03_101114 [Lachnotalea glycerini]|uniref:Uncharacterized protein n=1 Tax=Lachnotalea glycerini TaxID=1763509 RepID=A0A255IK41_9FIRM|nr:hypothetical protein [Lachnotalea glycerini]PXV95485.1 hypothetical protein C8E03_101114 [Lachnotalea glycerini]RDY32805.1 hypothetical protein CG710_002400 [Lachnotalea glycerini]